MITKAQWIVAATMVLVAGCQSPHETRLALPQAGVVVSMPCNTYRAGGVARYGIDYGSNIPFGHPRVQILSGAQVVIDEPVPQHYAVMRKVYGHMVRLAVDNKPLPPGSYGLRVTFGDHPTEIIPFTIRK